MPRGSRRNQRERDRALNTINAIQDMDDTAVDKAFQALEESPTLATPEVKAFVDKTLELATALEHSGDPKAAEHGRKIKAACKRLGQGVFSQETFTTVVFGVPALLGYFISTCTGVIRSEHPEAKSPDYDPKHLHLTTTEYVKVFVAAVSSGGLNCKLNYDEIKDLIVQMKQRATEAIDRLRTRGRPSASAGEVVGFVAHVLEMYLTVNTGVTVALPFYQGIVNGVGFLKDVDGPFKTAFGLHLSEHTTVADACTEVLAPWALAVQAFLLSKNVYHQLRDITDHFDITEGDAGARRRLLAVVGALAPDPSHPHRHQRTALKLTEAFKLLRGEPDSDRYKAQLNDPNSHFNQAIARIYSQDVDYSLPAKLTAGTAVAVGLAWGTSPGICKSVINVSGWLKDALEWLPLVELSKHPFVAAGVSSSISFLYAPLVCQGISVCKDYLVDTAKELYAIGEALCRCAGAEGAKATGKLVKNLLVRAAVLYTTYQTIFNTVEQIKDANAIGPEDWKDFVTSSAVAYLAESVVFFINLNFPDRLIRQTLAPWLSELASRGWDSLCSLWERCKPTCCSSGDGDEVVGADYFAMTPSAATTDLLKAIAMKATQCDGATFAAALDVSADAAIDKAEAPPDATTEGSAGASAGTGGSTSPPPEAVTEALDHRLADATTFKAVLASLETIKASVAAAATVT